MTDLTITPPAGDVVLRPTAWCVVKVRPEGIVLAGDVLAARWLLSWAELEVLAALSVGEGCRPPQAIRPATEATGVDRRDLRQFIAKARLGGRVAPDVERWTYEIVDHPALTAAPPPPPSPSELISLRMPVVFLLREGRYDVIHHDGRRILSLLPVEVAALDALREPTTSPAVVEELRRRELGPLIDPDAVHALLGRLSAAGLLRRGAVPTAPVDADEAAAASGDRDEIIASIFRRHAADQAAAEATRESGTGVHRTKVVPVCFDMGTPLALGMIVAAAKAHDGGRLEERYWFRTDWVWSDERLDELCAEPAVYLCSNYIWSHQRCLEVSRQVKERSPQSITIHGGPDTPKYEEDAARHLERHPHVDVMVRGEGEATTREVLAALIPVLDGTASLAEALAEVPGITFRDGDRIVRTPDRDRIADIDELPSPYLHGLFDVYRDVPDLFVTLESNRGCPYGCTFCDWGSATTSRVRKYDLDRVFGEIQWCGDAGVSSVSVADANFGMFERDIEIAEKVAEVRKATGAPTTFGVSYAKNTVKHLEHIIRTLAGAGIMAQGVLSLQTMDTDTLKVIHRSNIKTERYDGIATQMRASGLPLMIELMMGLPGQTVSSFADDLQQCIDREVPARINRTTVLVNSPMNEPAYRAEHEIETSVPITPGANASIVSTASFTVEDYEQMELARRAMLVYENFGILRVVSRFVRHETGRREVDLYALLRERTAAEPERWPALVLLVKLGYSTMAPPFSWTLLAQDLRRLLVEEAGVADDRALATALRTQVALLPAYGRPYPEHIELDHDVAAWFSAIVSAKSEGHLTDWTDVVPRLGTFGPAVLTVDDPDGVTETSLGVFGEHSVVGLNWELDSPLSRARIAASQYVDYSQMLPRFEKGIDQGLRAGPSGS